MIRSKGTTGFLGLSSLLLLTFFVSTNVFGSSVQIQHENKQLLTSGTLNWLPIARHDSSKEIVIGGFKVEHQPKGNAVAENTVTKKTAIYVCLATHHGATVFGQQIHGEKKCTVTNLGEVASHDNYDLLENVHNSTRLSWVTWRKPSPIPVGAVIAESDYANTKAVARHVVGDENFGTNDFTYTHYIGTCTFIDSFGSITYVKYDGKKETAQSGEILVQIDPVFYELNDVKFNYGKTQIMKRTPQILRETTISNTLSKFANLAEALEYTFNYSIYWGQGHAMIKALNTSITKFDGTKLGYISWGIEAKSVQSNVTTVKIRLEPGTAVNVTLRANYTEMETPYTGNLVSLYEDGEKRSRELQGTCIEKTMIDVKMELSPIYFLSNMSLAPTTLPPPSTEAPTTTTTTTTKQLEYTSSKETHVTEKGKSEIDENLIVPPRKSDTANMQNDDGASRSVKDKVEATQSQSLASLAFKPSLTVISISAIVFYRIT